MSVVKKRGWKTVDLGEGDLADFAAMGGLEIDVLSDGAEGVAHYSEKPSKSKPEAADETVAKAAPKKKKKAAKLAEATSAPGEALTPTASTSETLDMSAWSEFDLSPQLIAGLARLRFTRPTPIQSAVIKEAIAGKDILGAAQTGSGKTLGFGLPIIHSILRSKSSPEPVAQKRIALCILPTRELAIQVKDHLFQVASDLVTIGVAVGGMSIEKQKRILDKQPDIIVGTPGRLAGLLGLAKEHGENSPQKSDSFTNYVATNGIAYLAIDEADRLLEDSHFRDLLSVLKFVYTTSAKPGQQHEIQTFVFSATLPSEDSKDMGKLLKKLRLRPVAERHVVDLTNGQRDTSAIEGPTTGSPQAVLKISAVPATLTFRSMFCTSAEKDREPYLLYYLHKKFSNNNSPCRVIVFVNAISYVYRLASILPLCFSVEGLKIVGIHSKMKQKDRLKKLDQFKHSEKAVLVATDLAARGLDLPHVNSVVHLQAPRNGELLIHRSGRTARAGNVGECIMIVVPEQASLWNKAVKMGLGTDIHKIEQIQLNSMDIKQVREIQSVASQIEGKTHSANRENKDLAWTKRICEEADLWNSDVENSELEKSDYDDYSDDEPVTKTNNAQIEKLKHQLNQLLKNPLPSVRNM